MKHYFLFGEEISKIYHEQEFEKVLEFAATGDFDLYYFDDGENDLDGLLVAYTGWGGFATITEDEFDQIAKIKK